VLLVRNGKLIVGGSFSIAGGKPANNIAEWDGHSWSALGSGTNGSVTALIEYAGDLVVAGAFTASGGKTSPYVALWTRKDAREIALDILPGSCTNPINDNEHAAQSRAVVPVAIMGSDGVDVHDIDPASITLDGASPLRWSYADVGAPADKNNDSCACSDAGPDGFEDLTLKFYRSDLLAALASESGARQSALGRNFVHVSGEFTDGSPFEGYDCVTLVGGRGAGAAADDATPRGFELLDNVPNPFNASTRIGFYLPEATHVRLELFNVLGQKVATLIDRQL